MFDDKSFAKVIFYFLVIESKDLSQDRSLDDFLVVTLLNNEQRKEIWGLK